MIFDVGDFYENLSISSKIGYNRTTISGTLHEEVSTFILLAAALYRVFREECARLRENVP
jgi:hypothetical protein